MRTLSKHAVFLTLIGLFGVFFGVPQASAVYSPLPVLVGSTSPCKNVVWIGAEGSGQTYADWQGLGSQVREGLDAYASHMDGYTIGFFPVPYPSASAELLLYNSTRKSYFDSIDSGVRETLTFLEYRYMQCPNEHYVLAGYSQGAMVMHRTLAQLLSPRKKQASMANSVLPRLDGVLAIADGDRVANQGGSQYGTALADGYGVSWAPLANGVKYTYPPTQSAIPSSAAWPASRFHSVCDAGDLVCDFSHANVTDGLRIHSYDYAPGGDGVVFVQSAATNISRTTREALPPLTVRDGALPSAKVGSPYVYDLDNTVTSGTGPFSWSATALPESGWSISSNGMISGTPALPGLLTLVAKVTDSKGMSTTASYSIQVAGSNTVVKVHGNMLMTSEGSLWSWGSNSYGEVGNGTTISQPSPVHVLDDVSDLGADESADCVSFAIKSDRTLWGWGCRWYGDLGGSMSGQEPSPIQLFTDVVSVTHTSGATLALRTDGTLWGWGANLFYGALGIGSTEPRPAPVKVMDDVASVVAGRQSVYVIKTDGTLWAWGNNSDGQIGNGTTVNQLSPVKVMDNVASVTSPASAVYAVKNDGTLWAWGANSAWQPLGDGTITPRTAPVQILAGVSSVSAGYQNGYAIKTDGTLWAWGNNTYGSVGDGTVENRLQPVQVLDQVAQIDAGNVSPHAIRTDGTLWGWGYNWTGQVGNGTTVDQRTPVKILERVLGASMRGGQTMHALLEDGTVWGWGSNWNGNVGDGTQESRTTPIQIFPT